MNEETFVIDALRVSFELEILNKFEMQNGELIIYLGDGTKAKIKTINIAW